MSSTKIKTKKRRRRKDRPKARIGFNNNNNPVNNVMNIDTNKNISLISHEYKVDFINYLFGGDHLCSGLCTITSDHIKDLISSRKCRCRGSYHRKMVHNDYFNFFKNETNNRINNILNMLSLNTDYSIFFKIKYFLNIAIGSRLSTQKTNIFYELKLRRFWRTNERYVKVFDKLKKEISDKENEYNEILEEYNNFADGLCYIDKNISDDLIFLCYYIDYKKYSKDKQDKCEYHRIMKKIDKYAKNNEHNILFKDLKRIYYETEKEMTEKYLEKMDNGYYEYFFFNPNGTMFDFYMHSYRKDDNKDKIYHIANLIENKTQLYDVLSKFNSLLYDKSKLSVLLMNINVSMFNEIVSELHNIIIDKSNFIDYTENNNRQKYMKIYPYGIEYVRCKKEENEKPKNISKIYIETENKRIGFLNAFLSCLKEVLEVRTDCILDDPTIILNTYIYYVIILSGHVPEILNNETYYYSDTTLNEVSMNDVINVFPSEYRNIVINDSLTIIDEINIIQKDTNNGNEHIVNILKDRFSDIAPNFFNNYTSRMLYMIHPNQLYMNINLNDIPKRKRKTRKRAKMNIHRDNCLRESILGLNRELEFAIGSGN